MWNYLTICQQMSVDENNMSFYNMSGNTCHFPPLICSCLCDTAWQGKVFENSDNWIYLKFEATLHGGEHA